MLEKHPAFQQATTILLYHALNDEVDTRPLIQRWGMQKRLILPVVKGNDLELRLFTGEKNLKTGAFNILEPIGQPFNDYNTLDLVIVPGVAFDKQGNRLGRGRGYYDRLLVQIPTTTYKIGLCFPYQLMDEIPAEPFDVRMDEIVTLPKNDICNDLSTDVPIKVTHQ